MYIVQGTEYIRNIINIKYNLYIHRTCTPHMVYIVPVCTCVSPYIYIINTVRCGAWTAFAKFICCMCAHTQHTCAGLLICAWCAVRVVRASTDYIFSLTVPYYLYKLPVHGTCSCVRTQVHGGANVHGTTTESQINRTRSAAPCENP